MERNFNVTSNDEKVKLIDFDIKIDTKKLPKIIQNIIKELEDYERKNDWVMYSGVVESIESVSKQCMVDGIISEAQYIQLLRRYRRYM